MAHDLVFNGEIYKGRFVPDDPARYSRTIERLEGKRARFVVGTEPRKRSDDQRAYYWAAIIRTVAIELHGDEYDRDSENEVHEHLLHTVLLRMLPERWLKERRTRRGVKFVLESRPSTSDLSREEMTAYISRAKDYVLREWGVTVPDIDHVSLPKRR